MTNVNLLFRRTHLYLGLLLLPWMAMYALSTVVFNHREVFRPVRPAEAAWTLVWEKDFAGEVPPGPDGLREFARTVLAAQGITAPFGVQRQGTRLTLNVQNFRHPLRITYDPAAKKLRAEERASSWTDVLARLHQRVGYGHPGAWNNVWAVLVDLFCFGTLVWIGTGLYLWWKIPSTRRWGWAAVAGGFGSIAILLGTL